MKKRRISEDLHHRRFLFWLNKAGERLERRIPDPFGQNLGPAAVSISHLGFERIVAQFGND